jgi:hypothetical protein
MNPSYLMWRYLIYIWFTRYVIVIHMHQPLFNSHFIRSIIVHMLTPLFYAYFTRSILIHMHTPLFKIHLTFSVIVHMLTPLFNSYFTRSILVHIHTPLFIMLFSSGTDFNFHMHYKWFQPYWTESYIAHDWLACWFLTIAFLIWKLTLPVSD